MGNLRGSNTYHSLKTFSVFEITFDKDSKNNSINIYRDILNFVGFRSPPLSMKPELMSGSAMKVPIDEHRGGGTIWYQKSSSLHPFSPKLTYFAAPQQFKQLNKVF
jgi:hypothetical protein